MSKNIRAGGQAVIEGVMMLVNGGWAMAVRKKDGEIVVESKPYTRWTEKNAFNKLPLVRGVVSFIEMMNLGMDSINRSADIYYETDSGKSFKDIAMTVLSVIIATALGLGLFVFLPILIGNMLSLQYNQFAFNLFIGALRFVFFFIYIMLISLMKDIKRLFMYHGAEHKAVFAFEDGVELTPENISKYSTKHPRCGTSFIFIVIATAIIFYAVFDTIIFTKLNIPNNPLNRFINHIALLPVVSAIAFEILTLAGKYFRNPIVKALILPGLLFQYITTKEPDSDMLEVSIKSLKAALKAAGLEDAVGNSAAETET